MPAPEWTDPISNSVLCGYFYIFFIVYAVIASLSLVGGIVIFATSKMPFGQLAAVILNIVLTLGISGTAALFLYLICDRALQHQAANEQLARR